MVEADKDDSYVEPEQPPWDKPNDQGNKLVEINLGGQGEEPQPIFTGTSLLADLR